MGRYTAARPGTAHAVPIHRRVEPASTDPDATLRQGKTSSLAGVMGCVAALGVAYSVDFHRKKPQVAQGVDSCSTRSTGRGHRIVN